MSTIIIYALCDPKTKEVRYIGQTRRTLKARFRQHISQCSSRTYLGNWVRSLGDNTPLIKELFIVPIERGDEAEIKTIAEYRANGARLVNTTNGGKGHAGHKPSAETRAKMSAAGRGRVVSAKTRAKMSAARKGKLLSAETIARMSVARTGEKRGALSPEWRANIGAARRGKLHTEEAKAKIRVWGIGRKMPPKSPETLQRMADAQRGKKHTPEHKAKIAAAGIGRPPTFGSRGRGLPPDVREQMRQEWLASRTCR